MTRRTTIDGAHRVRLERSPVSPRAVIRRPLKKANWSDYVLLLIIVPIAGAAVGLLIAFLALLRWVVLWTGSPYDPKVKLIVICVPIVCATIAECLLIRSILRQRSR